MWLDARTPVQNAFSALEFERRDGLPAVGAVPPQRQEAHDSVIKAGPAVIGAVDARVDHLKLGLP